MLITLLTERFNLKYHHETRERPIMPWWSPRVDPG